jgi:hypothetical protein
VARIGGWWLRSEEARPGESVLLSVNGSRQQGGWRGVGGRLHLTTERLIFTPHLIEAALRGRTWAAEQSDIVRIAVEPIDLGQPFAGGFRERLRVELRGQPPEFFAVNRLDDVIKRLREAGRRR